MTVIADRRSLHQYLLTFIKARTLAPLAHPGDVRTGFLAWLGPNGHQLNPAMTLALNGFGWIGPANVVADFTNFTASNLAGDAETVADFVLRYQYERLSNNLLLDDAARGQILGGLQIAASPTIAGHWNAWHPTDPANAGRTFPQKLAAFKVAMGIQGRLLTGEAVVALAAADGFNTDGWVTTQLAAIALAGGAGDRQLPKLHEAAACWNWALNAFAPAIATAEEVFTWLHMPLPPVGGPDPSMPAGLAAAVGVAQVAARNALVNVKATLHANNLATLAPGFNANWAAHPALVNMVAQLNRQAYAAMATMSGLTVVPASPIAVCTEYLNTDGVSWEHWWVEYNGIVVETFPTQVFEMNATALQQVQRMNPAMAAAYTVVRTPVQSLHPQHNRLVRSGMVQYL